MEVQEEEQDGWRSSQTKTLGLAGGVEAGAEDRSLAWGTPLCGAG